MDQMGIKLRNAKSPMHRQSQVLIEETKTLPRNASKGDLEINGKRLNKKEINVV